MTSAMKREIVFLYILSRMEFRGTSAEIALAYQRSDLGFSVTEISRMLSGRKYDIPVFLPMRTRYDLRP